jgi:hypothetical protein
MVAWVILWMAGGFCFQFECIFHLVMVMFGVGNNIVRLDFLHWAHGVPSFSQENWITLSSPVVE